MSAPDKNVLIKRVLSSAELPSPSASAMRIIQLTNDDNVSIRELERAISADPAFVAKLLKVANSARTTGRAVVSIKEALMMVGLPGLRAIVIGFSILEHDQKPRCKAFDYNRFWLHSLLVGLSFQAISTRVRLAALDEAFSIGLLANIGSLALASVFPEPYAKLLDHVNKKTDLTLEQVETDTLGLNHWELSAELLRSWGIPSVLYAPIEAYGLPDKGNLISGSREYGLLSALALSNVMADLICNKEARTAEKISDLNLWSARISLEMTQVLDIGLQISESLPAWSSLLNLDPSEWMNFEWVTEVINSPDVLSKSLDTSQEKLTLMLVDDEKSTRLLLTEILQNAGYNLLVATTGEEALCMMNDSRPDLLVTDWVMPGMSGLELIQKIRSAPWGKSMFTLVLTAKSEEDHLVESFEAGTNDYVPKPIKERVLLSRLKAGERMIRYQRETARQYKEVHELAAELSDSNRKLQELSMTDSLTGCSNRRFAIEHLEQAWGKSSRMSEPLSCLVIDLDWFKQVNDFYGHERGDEVLQLIAKTLKTVAGPRNELCRVGGDEFWLICPGLDETKSHILAEKLRDAVAKLNISAGSQQCTITVGYAEKKDEMPDVRSMIRKADQLLYLRKREAKANR